MSDVTYPFQGFGKGLNLRDKPDALDAAECIDALNVLFTDRGAIEQRPGFDNLTASALTNRVESLEPFYTSSGTKQLLAGCGTRLEGLNASGEVIDSETGLTAALWDFARFGAPNTEVAYAGNGTDTLRKWSGTEWTAPTATVDGSATKAMPKARYLCVMSPDNRLVATGFSTTTGGPNGATSSPSHVYFSEVGDPTSWMTAGTTEHPNNSIQLTPGDGEAIQGAIAWREFVFVFKETKFFVFYSTETDAEGDPIFLYRPVDTGVGLASPRALAADHTGVYFMGRGGVYRTTGEEPEAISNLVEPIWSGNTSSFYTGGSLAHASITNCALGIHSERLYLAFPTQSANNRVLVYDPRYEWWSLLDLPASCFANFRAANAEELVFGYASGEKHVGRHSSAYANDDGKAISSLWRSGWFNLQDPAVKTIRSSRVAGSGRVSMGIDSDFNINAGATDELDLAGTEGSGFGGEGTFGGSGYFGDKSSALVFKERRTAERGKVFSVHLSNATLNQEWSVHEIDHHVRETRRPEALRA